VNKLTNSKTRIHFFDIAKGILIIMVVFGHVMPENAFLHTFIYAWHVPAFFLINGMLLSHTNYISKKFSKILTNGLSKIILQYFIFGILLLLTRWAFSGFDISVLRWQVIDLFLFWGIGATWFLPTLFLAQVIYFIAKKFASKIESKFSFLNYRIILLFIGLCFFLIPFIVPIETAIIKVLFRSFIAAFFIIIGDSLLPYVMKFKHSTSPFIKIIFFLLSATISISIFLLTKNPDLSLQVLKISNPLIYFANAIFGAISIIFVALVIDILNSSNYLHKILTFFGLHSLNIMGTHQILQLILFIPIPNNYLLNIAFCILILIAELPIIFIIKKITSLFKRKVV
jgi:fucose 4-O-acetylase-like acetyltransferase